MVQYILVTVYFKMLFLYETTILLQVTYLHQCSIWFRVCQFLELTVTLFKYDTVIIDTKDWLLNNGIWGLSTISGKRVRLRNFSLAFTQFTLHRMKENAPKASNVKVTGCTHHCILPNKLTKAHKTRQNFTFNIISLLWQWSQVYTRMWEYCIAHWIRNGMIIK